MIKVYLAAADISRTFLLPITPPEIVITCGREVRTYSTVYDGDITFIRPPKAREISFESFLPGIADRFSLNNVYLGDAAVSEIMTYYRSPDPIRLIVSGGGLDVLCTIKEFIHRPGRGKRIDYRMVIAEKMGG